MIRAYFVVVATGVGLGIRQMEEKIQRKITESELEMPSWALATIAEKVSASTNMVGMWITSLEKKSKRRKIFSKNTISLSHQQQPALPYRLVLLQWDDEKNFKIQFLRRFPIRKLIDKAIEQLATNALNATPNTMLFNQTGQPTISVPLYWNEQNLPIGTQIVGGYAQEPLLLQIAHQLEIAQP